MAARVLVLPSPSCLCDEPVQVKVEGLSPLQEVTVRASLIDETGALFQSWAYYRAERNGELDLSCAASLGGSYRGVQPMGLLWALKSELPWKRLGKRNVLTPFCVTYEVYDGRGSSGLLLCSCRHERRFLAEGVQRRPVREGRLRGTLFLPPGEWGKERACVISGLKRERFSYRSAPAALKVDEPAEKQVKRAEILSYLKDITWKDP